jgi:hypothetical protein
MEGAPHWPSPTRLFVVPADCLRPVRKDRCPRPTNAAQRDMPIREIIKRMRHDGCGGRAGKVELMTGIDRASSRPVRKIVLRAK